MNSVLLKTIAKTIKAYPATASFLKGKRSIVQFEHIHISTMVEKEIDGDKVPIPLVLRNADEKSAADITKEIAKVRNTQLDKNDIFFKGQSFEEKLYIIMPGFLRRIVWKIMLSSPQIVYEKMGNVIVTSVGMMGQVNGWFVHKSIHPIAIGIGSVLKKPRVVGDEIKIRQVLYLTVLLDHNMVDGAPMARFVTELCSNLEKAKWE